MPWFAYSALTAEDAEAVAYYLKNVVPQWSLSTIYKGMADYMVIQVVVLLALLFWPQIALWLPQALR